MPLQEIYDEVNEAMQKAVDHCASQIGRVRTGRASGNLVENLRIEYYGQPTPLSQVGSISVPDARTIVIQPWDRSTLSAIERSILQSDLGLNPSNDGSVIRIPIPPLTEERRKEYVKLCKKFAEEGRVAVRGVRRDQMEVVKKEEKDKLLTEDDRKRGEDEIQKYTDKYIKDVDVLMAKKEKEILED